VALLLGVGVTLPDCVTEGVTDEDWVTLGVRELLRVSVPEGVRSWLVLRETLGERDRLGVPVCEADWLRVEDPDDEPVELGDLVGDGVSVKEGDWVRLVVCVCDAVEEPDDVRAWLGL